MKDLATIAELLTPLAKKDRKYEWGDQQQEAFEQIRTLLASAPMLQSPQFDEQGARDRVRFCVCER